VPRIPALADAYHDLLAANHEWLACWEPWAAAPPERSETRAFIEPRARSWLASTELPVVIAVREDRQWQLSGSVSLRIDSYTRSGEIGYWIDGRHEGRGLVSGAVAAVLDQAFGPPDLDRVSLHTEGGQSSRSLARRLGFVQEGILRQGLAFLSERRDSAAYSLLAAGWARCNDDHG
jgi:ribosomal-protein-serine acetyltransferase